jgi:hypothetical protein
MGNGMGNAEVAVEDRSRPEERQHLGYHAASRGSRGHSVQEEVPLPTNPPPGWYEPDVSIAKVKPLIDLASPTLEEMVRYGLALLARASVTARGGDEHAALFSLYHHLLGMIDESTVLLRQCAGSGIVLTLRSAFEALVSLEYMNEDFERRAFAWLVADVHRKWQYYKSLDRRLPQGKQSEQLRRVDLAGEEVQIFPPPESLDKQYARFERLLRLPKWSQAEAEWQCVSDQRKRNPKWHQLYGGPASIQGVAERVNRGFQYHLLYRDWSVTMHAAGLLNHFRKGSNGETGILPFRNGSELASQAHLGIHFGVAGITLVLRRYREGERKQFARWYAMAIKPTSDDLAGKNLSRRQYDFG